ncbi:MAG: FKBP-type peptidyl-prolyl cis-trans isomerase [Clostridia bacterium]|nr:FKBP-type peptidyl-prolyl cis-trans isomerase [Clostridia bacterium]
MSENKKIKTPETNKENTAKKFNISESKLALVITAGILVLAILVSSIIALISAIRNDAWFNYLKSDLDKYVEVNGDYKDFTVNLDIAKPKDIEVDVAVMSLRNSNKDSAKWREITSGSKFTLGVGDAVDIYYRGYLLDEDGKEIVVDGMSNFGDANPYTLVLGSGSFVPGFELNMVGLNIEDTNIFTTIKEGKPFVNQIAYVSYTRTIDGDANSKVTVTNARIDLSRDDIDAEYGENFKSTILGLDIGTKVSLPSKLDGKDYFYTDLVVNFVTVCETKHFTVECYFPYDYTKENLRNETAYFEVYVNKVVDYTDVPEFDDEFINKLTQEEKLGVTLDVLNTFEGANLVEKYYAYANKTLMDAYEEEYKTLLREEIVAYYRTVFKGVKYPASKVEEIYNEYYASVSDSYNTNGGKITNSYGSSTTYDTLDKYAVAYLGLQTGTNWKNYLISLAQDAVKERYMMFYILRAENLIPSDADFEKKVTEVTNTIVDEYVEYCMNYEGKTKDSFKTEAEYQEYYNNCRKQVLANYDKTYFEESAYFEILMESATKWPKVVTLDERRAYPVSK